VSALRDVVDFINEGFVNAYMVYPETGQRIGSMPVFFAVSKPGVLSIVWRFGAQATAVASHVHEIIPFAGGFRCRIDYTDVGEYIEFIPADDRDAWFAYRDEMDDMDTELESDARLALEQKGPLVEPVADKDFKFVRWSEIGDFGFEMCGVLLQGEGGQIEPFPFPGFEAAAGRWRDLKLPGPDGLDQVASYAGRQDIISGSERIKAASWEDAARLAQYKVAKDWYLENGKSVYPS